MQLHLVTMQGAEHTFLLNANLFTNINETESQRKERKASLLASLKSLKIPPKVRHVFLLQLRYEDRNQIRYILFVPEPHTSESFAVDADRTYIENGGVDVWTKGMENRNSRLYSLYKMRESNIIMEQGYGEAAGTEPERSWFVDLLNEAW